MEGVVVYGECDQLVDMYVVIVIVVYYDVVVVFQCYVEEVGFVQVFYQVDYVVQWLVIVQFFVDLFGVQVQGYCCIWCDILWIDIGQQLQFIGDFDLYVVVVVVCDYVGKEIYFG